MVTGLGILGFHLAGKKVWWSWYINLGCQALWFTYAVVTSTPAFIVAALFYTFVFGNNAKKWTKEQFSTKKEASGNISKDRNRRRPSVYWWLRKRLGARHVGERARTVDGNSS
jgi:hypothetical protein